MSEETKSAESESTAESQGGSAKEKFVVTDSENFTMYQDNARTKRNQENTKMANINSRKQKLTATYRRRMLMTMMIWEVFISPSRDTT